VKTFLATLLLALPALIGCATIVGAGPDRIAVNSNPEGAKVYVDEEAVGVTPTAVYVRRKGEGVIRVVLPDGRSMERDVDKVCNGWLFGNVIIGGLIGFGIDFALSNQGKYPEAPIFFDMTDLKKPVRQNASEPVLP